MRMSAPQEWLQRREFFTGRRDARARATMGHTRRLILPRASGR